MKHFSHLTDEEIVAHHYGETDDDSGAHLLACASCAKRSEALKNELAQLRLSDAPERGSDFADRTWSRIRAEIVTTSQQRPIYLLHSVKLRYALFATACAVLLATAFIAGRYWQKYDQQPVQSAHANTSSKPVQPPVVVVVLADHLDRSEQFLVELKHADAEDEDALGPMREEAKSLLVANRKVIQQPAASGDPQMQAALSKLNHLLIKLAAGSGKFTPEDLDALQQELNSDKLLFEIRVLRTTSHSTALTADDRNQGERAGGTI